MPPKTAAANKSAAKTEKVVAAKAEKNKRVPSPYIKFCSENRPRIKLSHPNATFAETGKILGDMWAAAKKAGGGADTAHKEDEKTKVD